MDKEKVTKIIGKEFGILLFFYSRESNANNMCGSYNIFLNNKLDADGITSTLKILIIQIEKMKHEKQFDLEKTTKKIDDILLKLKKGD